MGTGTADAGFLEIPEVPKIPIDISKREIDHLKSLGGVLEKIYAVGRLGDRLHVLGVREAELILVGTFPVVEDGYTSIVLSREEGKILELDEFENHDKEKFEFLFYLTLGRSSKVRELRAKQKTFRTKVEEYKQTNLREAAEKIRGIRLSQGDIFEAEREFGRPLRIVGNGVLQSPYYDTDAFLLRVKAYRLGADAIIRFWPGTYEQRYHAGTFGIFGSDYEEIASPTIGTPVRYADKSLEKLAAATS